jgi:NDP-sugar pyrophosphorylase family protein
MAEVAFKMRRQESTTALILAGGLGTRLRPVVADRPKVLARVNGRPFVQYIFDQLIEAGFQEVVICAGYMGDVVKRVLGSVYDKLNIRYSLEKEPLGTGGAIRLALPMIETKQVMALNGDSYVDVRLSDYLNWHENMKIKASLLIAKVNDTDRYGCVQKDEVDRIVNFQEKGVVAGPGWINAGIYLFDKDVLKKKLKKKYISLEHDILPTLAGHQLFGYPCEAKFIDIGVPESYSEADAFFNGIVFRVDS